jgi:TetR/AcrR family transcriptional regulator of autoinduction and epiphytic fitness
VNGPRSVEAEESGDPAPLDGRAARSAKTRNAIADAMLDLLTEGHSRPTAKEIAERASVSVRSVYVHFDDLEDLFCVAAKRHFARIAPMLTPVPSTGSLEERAEALVHQRIRLYAKAGAVGRATRISAETSPTLARVLRDARTLNTNDLARVFRVELARLDAPKRAQTLGVLDVLSSAATWQTLREQYALSVDDAVQCIIDSIVTHLRAGGA